MGNIKTVQGLARLIYFAAMQRSKPGNGVYQAQPDTTEAWLYE
jgi:hypothetical protein